MNPMDIPEIQFSNENAFPIDQLKKYISLHMKTHGILRIRKLKLETIKAITAFKKNIGWHDFSYIGGNSPRTKLAPALYTASDFPPSGNISLHNELSYMSHWPSFLLFYCKKNADTGGETLLASNAEFTKKLSSKTKKLFQKKNILYTHTMPGKASFGQTWQQVFQTDSKVAVENFCLENQIKFQWTKFGSLRTFHHRTAFQQFSYSKFPIWFSQVDQWHDSTIAPGMQKIIKKFSPEKALPHQSFFQDGSLIPTSLIEEIQDTFSAIAIKIKLDAHDVLILNNEMIAHGRLPYQGERELLVSLG